RQRRDDLAGSMVPAPVPSPVAAPMPRSLTPLVPAAAAVPVPSVATTVHGPESSTRTVQNVLFILGGLLLGTAAIVFTAVAWATYGVGGRAAILAVVTVLALTAPLVALRRGLAATAETFAAVGLLLVVLDGYAAWYVNLFGVAEQPGSRYAGLVALVAALVAAGYGALTRLTGPLFVAMLAIQPVAPLLAVSMRPSVAGWSLIATVVGAMNLVIVWRPVSGRGAGASRVAMRALASVLFGVAVL